jgi:hypothetical protein
MTAQHSSDSPDYTEIWEATSGVTAWVMVTDQRGRDVHKPVGGPGMPNRIRISTADREYNQETSPDGSVFDIGVLRRVDGEHAQDFTQPGKTDAQLLGYLQNAENLEDLLMEESELNVRRLYSLANGDAADKVSFSAMSIIKHVIDRRWPPAQLPSTQLDAIRELTA